MVVSPTSRFADVLGQFPNFINVINGLKNELHIYVQDFYLL